MTETEKRLKKYDVVIYMINYSKDDLGMFTYEMDYNLDLTYVHLLTHNGQSIDMNALRSSLWRVSNVWSTGYYKSGRMNYSMNRKTKFVIPLLYSDLDEEEAKRIVLDEIDGEIAFMK